MSEFVFMPLKKLYSACTVRIGRQQLSYKITQSYVYKDGVLTADGNLWYINDTILFERYYVRILERTKHTTDTGLHVYLIDAETHTEIASEVTTDAVYISRVIVKLIATHEHWTTRDYMQRGLFNTLQFSCVECRFISPLFGYISLYTSALNDAFYYQFNVGDFRYDPDPDDNFSDDYYDDNVKLVNSKIFYMDEAQPSLQHLITVIISSMREAGE